MENRDLEIHRGENMSWGRGKNNIWFPNPGISSLIKLSIFPRNAEQEHRLDKEVEKVHPRGDAAKLPTLSTTSRERRLNMALR